MTFLLICFRLLLFSVTAVSITKVLVGFEMSSGDRANRTAAGAGGTVAPDFFEHVSGSYINIVKVWRQALQHSICHLSVVWARL